MIRDDSLQLHIHDDPSSLFPQHNSKGGKHAFKLRTRIIVYRKYALYASRNGRLWSTNDHGVCSCNKKNLQYVAEPWDISPSNIYEFHYFLVCKNLFFFISIVFLHFKIICIYNIYIAHTYIHIYVILCISYLNSIINKLYLFLKKICFYIYFSIYVH